ncbi:DNA repair protein RadA [Candidatus Poribacteria bacterium]|nr:MAG: DNA repair protein RadA [Candidatus Poribacteria bacterium]
MAKPRTRFVCRECGYISPKWMGRCPECGEWNSFEEEVAPQPGALGRRPPVPFRSEPVPLSSIEPAGAERLSTGIGELDRVLGGGLVPGSVVLIGGDPGIGKSTLLLQASARMSELHGTALYVTGEESLAQIKMRAERLSISSDRLYILCEMDVGSIKERIGELKPKVVVIDSIQAVYKPELESSPGSITQVRECAAEFTMLAKGTGTPFFLVGHVTKEGAIAGPKLVEHMVDTVLYFEGDKQHAYRILRAAKNRFGSTNEIGVFEMRSEGLVEVLNPSAVFLADREEGSPGSVVVAGVEGTRPILFELQALVVPTNATMPRRATSGVDRNRLALLLAVLEKRVGLKMSAMDVFVNVTGGLQVVEPGADLGVVAAIVSSARELPIDPGTVIIGEVGLSGEVRGVSQAGKRVSEASKLGFKRVIMPEANLRSIDSTDGVEVVPVRNIFQALSAVLSGNH